MKEDNYHLFFGMFYNRLKIDIISELSQKPMEVNLLSRRLKQERSKVSHALLVLNKCHLVESEKKGKNRLYAINKETIAPLLTLADKHVSKYCKNCWAKNNGG